MKWSYKTFFVDPGEVDAPSAHLSENAREMAKDLIRAAPSLRKPLLEEQLNELGGEGWELVAIVPCHVLETPSAVAIFKRPT